MFRTVIIFVSGFLVIKLKVVLVVLKQSSITRPTLAGATGLSR